MRERVGSGPLLSGEPAGMAVFDGEVEEYRYLLTRTWDPSKPRVLFVMLNPSTATQDEDDPTQRRCRRFAKDWGFGGYEVVNIFALRSTDPKGLYVHPAPVGPGNDAAILDAHLRCAKTIAAWGVHGALQGRGVEVLRVLVGSGRPVFALAVTSDGYPGHPLYLPADSVPQPFGMDELGG